MSSVYNFQLSTAHIYILPFFTGLYIQKPTFNGLLDYIEIEVTWYISLRIQRME